MKLERVALFLQLIVLGASANGTNRTANATNQSPTTKRVQELEDHKRYVVNLTRDSFNESVTKEKHFVMFFDAT